MSDELLDLQKFKGLARLFPLPNLVLFPCMMQGLHIFEPRYRQMTADALADDRLIALVLLQAGWEGDYEGKPAIHPTACLGKITTEQRLEDGRYNLQLRGLCRVRIEAEIDSDTLYRTAHVQVLSDIPVQAVHNELLLRRRLMGLVPPWCAGQPQALTMFQKVLKSNLTLGTISDLVGFALPLPLELKQKLLDNANVEQRVREMVDFLEANKPAKSAQTKFPPEFSAN